MGDLASSVHTGIRAAGHNQTDRSSQDGFQRVLNDCLHGPLTGLAGPAGEICAVVAQVEPKPDDSVAGRFCVSGGVVVS